MPVKAGIKSVKKHKGGVKGVMERTKNAALKVGLNKGLGEHPNSDSGISIVEVGAFNEFGTSRIPERPFIRTTIAKYFKEYFSIKRKLLAAIIRGDMDVKKAIGILGLRAQSDVIQSVNLWTDPPNSETTIALKGSSQPLVDTGIMKKSIHWEAL